MSIVRQQEQAPPKEEALDLAQMVRQHQAGIWRYLRFLGASGNEVDDLVQDTFLAFVRANQLAKFSFRSDASTLAYLRQVARNQLLQRRRRQGHEMDTVQLTSAEQVWSEVAAEDGLDDYLQTLRKCKERLTGRSKKAIQLQYQQGLGRAEVADTLGMSLDGVKTLLRRTRERLRKCVESNMKHVERGSK